MLLVPISSSIAYTHPSAFCSPFLSFRFPSPHSPRQSKPPDLEWFPRLRCMSLHSADDTEPEQNEIKDLREQLAETTSLVKTLSQQLGDLRDKVAFHCVHVNVLQQRRGGGGLEYLHFRALDSQVTTVVLLFPPRWLSSESSINARLSSHEWDRDSIPITWWPYDIITWSHDHQMTVMWLYHLIHSN